MKITRIYSDAAGESHFEDIEINLAHSSPLGKMSDPLPISSMILRENSPGYTYEWHCAPQRQYIVMLEGLVRIQTSDGTTRIFKPGEIVFLEDTTGKGHKSDVPDGKPRKSIFLTVPD